MPVVVGLAMRPMPEGCRTGGKALGVSVCLPGRCMHWTRSACLVICFVSLDMPLDWPSASTCLAVCYCVPVTRRYALGQTSTCCSFVRHVGKPVCRAALAPTCPYPVANHTPHWQACYEALSHTLPFPRWPHHRAQRYAPPAVGSSAAATASPRSSPATASSSRCSRRGPDPTWCRGAVQNDRNMRLDRYQYEGGAVASAASMWGKDRLPRDPVLSYGTYGMGGGQARFLRGLKRPDPWP